MKNLCQKAPRRRSRKVEYISPDVPEARILVVDDDPLLRELYSMLLRLENYEIETAANGLEALERFKQHRFDLVLTDRNMPKVNGVALIRRLRKAGSNVPIVMISGSISENGLPDDVAREVSAALPKPISAGQMFAAVEFALRPDPEARLKLIGHNRLEETLAADLPEMNEAMQE